MNWDAIAAIGQMLGSLAVFITLGYLAVQVRHARSDARRALSQGRNEALRDLMLNRATDPELNTLYGKAYIAFGGKPSPFVATLMERAGMTLEEATPLNWDQFAWYTYRLSIIPNVGELSPPERTQFDWSIRVNYGNPGIARLFYESFIKPNAHPDTVRYIDNLLAQPA